MTKKLTLHAVTLAALLAASSVAMAATPPQGPGVVTLTNTTGNLWTASIGDTPAMGVFTDIFTLTPNATPGSWAWGSVINTSFFGSGNISFTSADLNGTPLLTGAIPVFPTTLNIATLLPAMVSGPLTLTIHGVNTGGGSYGGDINVAMAPVPEPSTYGMMLAGVGILGMLARRRKQS
jgi:hypothetical protein